MATQTQIDDLTALYAGYFDRAPDPVGLKFWTDQIDGGREYNTIAADFAVSSEALALYPFLSTPDVSSPDAFVTAIYANLFNRAPDAAGLEFWAGLLTAGTVSVADMIEEIINGAVDAPDATQPTFDKTTLDNKIEAGSFFVDAAGNTPGFTFDAAAAAAAVEVLNGVTNDPATVDAARAEVDAFLFTLTAGIEAIESAELAVETFLATEALDYDEDPDTLTIEADVATELTNDVAAIDTLVAGANVAAPGFYAAASTGVQNALVADVEVANAATLVTANSDLDDANDAAALVSGLPAAIEASTAAQAALTAATKADNLAGNATAAAVANFDTLSGNSTVTVNFGALSAASIVEMDLANDAPDAGDETVIEYDVADETFVLSTGVTEADYEGVTAVLNALNAELATKIADVEAGEAVLMAVAIVENLDLTAAREAALNTVGGLFTATTPADADTPTVAEIEAEADGLAALLATADAAAAANGDIDLATAIGNLDADITTAADNLPAIAALTATAVDDGYITAADKLAIDAAPDSADANTALAGNNPGQRDADFATAVGVYEVEAGLTPLATAVIAAEDAVADAETAITGLAEAVADLAVSQANADTLEGLNDAIDDAIAVFETQDLEAPVALNAAVVAATANDDVFYLGTDAAPEILSFGVLGDDSIVFGTDYVLNTDEVAGDNGANAALEFWATDDGTDTTLTLETSAIESNATNPDFVTITLAGVTVDEISFADGVLSLA